MKDVDLRRINLTETVTNWLVSPNLILSGIGFCGTPAFLGVDLGREPAELLTVFRRY